MSELHLPLIDELAEKLVTPERFGDAALQDTVEFEPILPDYPDLPETRRMHEA